MVLRAKRMKRWPNQGRVKGGKKSFVRTGVAEREDCFVNVTNPGVPVACLPLQARSLSVTPLCASPDDDAAAATIEEGDTVADLRSPRPAPARSLPADPMLAYHAACSFTPSEYEVLVAKHAEVCSAADKAGGMVRRGNVVC